MTRILVTGGAGYIGSHICKALYQKGYEPLTIDNLSLGHRSAVKWGPFIQGNCGDTTLLRNVLEKTPIEGVIHLAALSNVRESHHIPLQYFQNNVAETLSLLQVLTDFQVPHFVFSSTCAVYGIPKQTPIDETHPLSPVNLYGNSKKMVEEILQTASEAHGTHIALLRYFNATGADPDGEIGESHDPETHLLPLLVQTALKIRPSFTLFGENHDTPDGTPIRDLIHVTDLAHAHVHALETLIRKKENLTLNLGTGKGYSIRQVIEAIEKRKGVTIPLTLGEKFPGDPPVLVANPRKAQKILSWSPQHSSLETLIDTTWNWISQV